ncbi:unnamed protein product [Lymnaea stagnalis]|uniref:Uncharacterized protein n=1 Tax=Lymnaea stagnalis TaxID=6523 RepID=A0AAV2HTU6_LYMST
MSKKPNKWALVDPTPVDLATRMSSKESVLGVPTLSLPHEESILEHYFTLLSQASFDKAKELVDTEKDGHKFSNAASWGEILQCLSQLATAEKNYSNLVFLGQKRFTHIVRSKDSAKSIYSMLFQEFQRMENFLTPLLRESSTHLETDQLLAHISGQLSYFVRARIKMIEFYEQLASLGAMRQWMNFDDLIMILEEIVAENVTAFHHPLGTSLKTVFSLECESLSHLLKALLLMTTWSYMQCVLQLHQAHSKLNTWGTMIPIKEVKSSFGRSSSKSNPFPPIYTWMYKLKGILLSKFALYFYDVLAKQTIPSEMKANLSKVPEDFVGRIQAFQKKSDATNIYLVLDAEGLSGRVGEGGYHHPNKYAEPTQGMETYPPIYSYPMERTINSTRWHTIIMIMNSSTECTDKIQFMFEKATDKKPQTSYFIIRVDIRIALVVIFESKKNERDSTVNTFMTDLASQLRCQTVMAGLKNFARS